MASLPSNTFMFNYNAREMYSGSGSYIIPKTQGQLYDDDITLASTSVTAHTEDGWAHIATYQPVNFGSTAANPFNRNSSNSSFTFIYKTHNFASGNLNLFANRKGNYNYMVRATMFHTSQSGFLSLAPNSNPQIGLIRIYSDGKSERMFLDSDGNVLQSVSSSTISWGNQNDAIAFFAGSANGGELFNADFYWMYCSLETLTDDEVKKVIAYNENTTTFETDITAITATYNSTTSSVTLTAEEDMAWTASTLNDWITLSTTGGTGSSVFTVNVAANKAYIARNGLVTLTNGEDTIEITVEQAKHPLLIPNENIYRADLEVIKGYRSGSVINKAYRSGELIYYKLNYSQPTPPTPDYSHMPLTFEVTDVGTIVWRKAGKNAPARTIQYSINNGSWQSITANDTTGTTINVSAGDVVQFKGYNTSYASQGSYITACRFAGTAKYYAYGNIMSLIYGDNFIDETTLTENYTFPGLFFQATGLQSHSTHKLVLPATTLTNNCYQHMFYGCSNMEMAPELPAPTLAEYSYSEMFGGCNKLTYIKCLATNISASRCTLAWVNGVSSSAGTFVTPSSTNWTTGNNGIPSGWTRVDA